MAEKQVLAALEITDHEIRLLVGEYYNTRVNVLLKRRIPTGGMQGLAVKNAAAVSKSIKDAVNEASKSLGTKIERVLLSIPSYRVVIDHIKVGKGIDNYDRAVTMEDLQILARKGFSYPVSADKVLINWMPLRYLTNRIAFKNLPIGEPCDLLEIEMDVFSADKLTAYDYAKTVEGAGLGVIDICLDCFAAVKETALFEQTFDRSMILAVIEHERTTLVFVRNGRLEAVKLMESGYSEFTGALIRRFPISEAAAEKLVFQNAELSEQIPDATPVYLWMSQGKTQQISAKDLKDTIKPVAAKWLGQLRNSAADLLKIPGVGVMIAGQGAELDGLSDYISRSLGVEAHTYYPDTVGTRESTWTTCLGMIYSFIDVYPLYHNKRMSVKQDAYLAAVAKKKPAEEPDDAMTRRLRGFFQNK